MKNFQKLVLGLIIGVMAIGFSAFTNAKQVVNGKLVTQFEYTNIHATTVPNSTNPSDYRYLPDSPCDNSVANTTCKANWLESSSTEPAENSQPLGTFAAKSVNGVPIL